MATNRDTQKDKIPMHGYYFKCLHCKGNYIHQRKMMISPGGIVTCPKCNKTIFEIKKK